MKKKFKVTLVVFLVVILGCFSNVFADTNTNVKFKTSRNVKLLDSTTIDDGGVIGTATAIEHNIGDSILVPEIGWKRYDDENSKISYQGNWTNYTTGTWGYEESVHQTQTKGECSKFIFYGTKIRVIGAFNNTEGSDSVSINIDNKDDQFACNSQLKYPVLVFEKDNLPLGIHTVTITNNTSLWYWQDAIDIDSNGFLIDPSAILSTGISLNKTTDSLTVGQADILTATVAPDDVANKTVTWTSSDPSTVAVDSTGKATALKAGTATIKVMTTDGTNISTSCNVTVKDPESSKSKLTLYMNDKTIREFYLTENELDDFINWYNLKSEGEVTVQPYYVFNVHVQGSSLTKKSYVWFTKIENFEVE